MRAYERRSVVRGGLLGMAAAAVLSGVLTSSAQAAFVYDLRAGDTKQGSAEAGSTVTLDLWLKQTDKGANGNYDATDTATSGIISIVSTGVNGFGSGGITGATISPLFNDPAAAKVGGPAADVNGDGVTDWGSIATSGGNLSPPRLTWRSTTAAAGGTPATAVPGQSQQAADGSWEWKIASFTVKVGNTGSASFVPLIPTGLALGTSPIAGRTDNAVVTGSATTAQAGAPVSITVGGVPPVDFITLDGTATQPPQVGTITVTKNGPGQYTVKPGDEFNGSANVGNIRITGIDEPGDTVVIAQFDGDPGALATAAQGAATPADQQLAANYGFTGPNFRVFHFSGATAGDRFFDFDLPAGVNVTRAIAVPEPASMSLLGLGAIGLLARRRRNA